MSLTINHQTNDISATSGSVTIGGSAVGGSGVHTLINTTKITSSTSQIDITGIDAKFKIVLVKYALRGGSAMSGARLVLGVNGTMETGTVYTTNSNSMSGMQLDGGWAQQQGAGHFEIFNMGDSGARTIVFSKHVEATDAYTNSTLGALTVSKFATKNTTAYNSFRITGSFGGSYTSGFMNVYGIADS